MSALGIWLFVRINSFGSRPECTHSTIYYLAGHYVPANQPSVRIVIYFISAIPIINVTILLYCVWGLDALVTRLAGSFGKNPPDRYILPVITAFLLVIGLIVSTEKTIINNNVGPGGGQWSFGQTLSLILTLPSLWTVIIDIWEMLWS